MFIFLCNLYIFVWIQYCCLAYTVSALDPEVAMCVDSATCNSA